MVTSGSPGNQRESNQLIRRRDAPPARSAVDSNDRRDELLHAIVHFGPQHPKGTIRRGRQAKIVATY